MSKALLLHRRSNDMRLRAMREAQDAPKRRVATLPALRYEVYYRVPMSELSGRSYGCWRRGGEEAAIAFAREFDRPGCWALVVHPETFARVAEFGTPFADLPAVTLERKPVARAAAGQAGQSLAAGAVA